MAEWEDFMEAEKKKKDQKVNMLFDQDVDLSDGPSRDVTTT